MSLCHDTGPNEILAVTGDEDLFMHRANFWMVIAKSILIIASVVLLISCRSRSAEVPAEPHHKTQVSPNDANDPIPITVSESITTRPSDQVSGSQQDGNSEPMITPPVDTRNLETTPVDLGLTIATGTVVHADALNLREGPDLESTVVGLLFEGDQIQVLAWQEPWRFVCCLADGLTSGWVHGDYLQTNMTGADQVSPAAINHYSQGIAKYKQGQYVEAIHELGQVISIESQWIQGYLARGHVQKAQGLYSEALADFDQVLLLDEYNIGAANAKFCAELHEAQIAGTVQDISHEDNFPIQADVHYRLRWTDGIVTASIHSAGAFVSPYPETQSVKLFKVPDCLRPPAAVTREIASSVTSVGSSRDPEQDTSAWARLRLEPEGQVLLEGSLERKTGEPPGFSWALVWHTRDAQPKVCNRNDRIQNLILNAISHDDCSAVTWQQLAEIRILGMRSESEPPDQISGQTFTLADPIYHSIPPIYDGPSPIFESAPKPAGGGNFVVTESRIAKVGRGNNDYSRAYIRHPWELAGLSGLEELALIVEPLNMEKNWPVGLLEHSPHLSSLVVWTDNHILPEDFLSGVPRITHLHLFAPKLESLPNNFLANNPLLTELTLEFGELREFPEDLLNHNANLEVLALRIPNAPLPTSILQQVPQLTHLYLYISGSEPLPADFLAPVPLLQELLLAGDMTRMPPNFLVPVPELTHLTLWSDQLTTIPAEFLRPVPRLTRLILWVNGLTKVPHDFLQPVSKLQELMLWMDQVSKIPADLLALQSKLEVLHLYLHGIRKWPTNLLAPAPHLGELTLDARSVQEVPDNFLADMPQLTALTLWVESLRSLPEDTLALAPVLSKLAVWGPRLSDLPNRFLAQAPQLTGLVMQIDGVTRLPETLLETSNHLADFFLEGDKLIALPASLLANSPALERTSLQSSSLPMLPPGFLAHVPLLTDVALHLPSLTVLPPDFLVQAPQLQFLRLRLDTLPQLPGGFLSDTPQLSYLYLEAYSLEEVPQTFLQQASNFLFVDLETTRLTGIPDQVWPHLFWGDSFYYFLVTESEVNLRTGPGGNHTVIDLLDKNQVAKVLAPPLRNSDGLWFRAIVMAGWDFPHGQEAFWISGEYLAPKSRSYVPRGPHFFPACIYTHSCPSQDKLYMP